MANRTWLDAARGYILPEGERIRELHSSSSTPFGSYTVFVRDTFVYVGFVVKVFFLSGVRATNKYPHTARADRTSRRTCLASIRNNATARVERPQDPSSGWRDEGVEALSHIDSIAITPSLGGATSIPWKRGVRASCRDDLLGPKPPGPSPLSPRTM